MKPDEPRYYAALKSQVNIPFLVVDAIGTAHDLGIHYKRAEYLLNKWIDRGWLDCGISCARPWFTETAPESLDN